MSTVPPAVDLPDLDVAALTRLRQTHPELLAERWAARRRRHLGTNDGRMLLVAADHPARGALGVRDEPMAMASRGDLLRRLAAALSRPGVDGVLGTPDVLEDLLLLGLLDDKIVVGSMNRGGIAGASFELDDRFTGYDAPALAAAGIDGGKMLLRIALDDPATAPTMQACAHAVSDLAAHRLMAMVEPFLSGHDRQGRVGNLLDTESVIHSVHVAAGLGTTSAYTWLKLPVVDDMTRVLDATTLPTLLLGGDPTDAPDAVYARWGEALAHPVARGLVVGRTLLYPPDGRVADAVDAAAALVHHT
ncbi:Cgl0159 family (beta/alpha)8-fold protein [Mobilicoccus pelagius]|uniref:Cgl0159-like domain-containing protein n=1 Tax=Mobilicoccus pelagius NBRC 104925 TaxID=1089455 RepID=H5USV3_9MICO|nr:hypothetical protein [Mobilicoccus pelagius]GAB48811.1 hypothetical protein MOPEL_083_00160 [Mobilicoccus pelagius NBRC 104925]